MKCTTAFVMIAALGCLAGGSSTASAESMPIPSRNPERAVASAEPDVTAAPPEAAAPPVTPDTSAVPSGAPEAQLAEPVQTGDQTTTVAAVPPSATETTQTSEQAKAGPPTPAPVAPAPAPTQQAALDPASETTASPEQAATPAAGEAEAPAGDEAKAETQDDTTDVAAGPGIAPENAPLPDINPNRDPMSPKAPEPALDYAAILKPLLNYQMSSADRSRLSYVMRNPGSIDETAAKISDGAVRDFGIWYRSKHLKSTALDADAIEAFRVSHPYWPGQDTLRLKAESSLFLKNAPAEKIKAYFASSPPETGAGKAAMASAYLSEGKTEEAKAMIAAAWRHYYLSSDVEKKILDKFGKMLTEADHRARVDVLLYPDRTSATPSALRIAKQLPEAERKKVNARIAVVKRQANAGKLLDALPDDAVEDDIGLRFNNIQWLRRTEDKEQRLIAWKLLRAAPLDPDVLLDMDEWWIERRVNVRAALNDGHPRIAYEIAAKHGLESGNSLIDAEFLAGWVALRYLDEPHTALRHFLSLRQAADDSRSIARAEYWLGRTALTLGDRGSAAIHFHGAAKYPQYFYGQLGRQALDPRPARLAVTSTPVPTQADIDAFMGRHGVRAIGIARAAKVEWVVPQFFLALSRKLENSAEVALLAELAKAMGRDQIALRLSKIAFGRDLAMGDYALPVGVMPSFKSLAEERVDPALVHALSRQESEFNAKAKSPVGASGLMQLMPATARGVARRYKVAYSQSRLITSPAYNTQLGEAFLSDLIASYNGSYFMALAAYNAGPGRVKEWVEIYGDPRTPEVDPIDWIERIPFTETRRYVIKIMETLQLYRSRLAGPTEALHLVQDLNRGRQVPPHATASVATIPTSETP